jgi:hypothetical protein
MEMFGIDLRWWIALALISMALGFQSSRNGRNKKACADSGHFWQQEGYELVCNRCGKVS